MATGNSLEVKSYAVEPRAGFDEGNVVSVATPRLGDDGGRVATALSGLLEDEHRAVQGTELQRPAAVRQHQTPEAAGRHVIAVAVHERKGRQGAERRGECGHRLHASKGLVDLHRAVRLGVPC